MAYYKITIVAKVESNAKKEAVSDAISGIVETWVDKDTLPSWAKVEEVKQY